MDKLIKLISAVIDLQRFNNTNLTSDSSPGNDLSQGMRIYYDDCLLDEAQPELVHDQFGQKHPIPKNKGEKIQFRKYSPLPKLLTPLQEGVTPDGQKMNSSIISATVKEYGGYIEISDLLDLLHADNNILQATKLLGSQAGRTCDSITREVLNGGTNVQYGDSLTINARHLLNGGEDSSDGNTYLTVKAIQLATRYLKSQNAKKINGSYVAIIHPDVAYDIMNDKRWIDVKQYSDPDDLYEGEIGKLLGVRFVESTEAKIFTASPLSAANRNLTAKASSDTTSATVNINETLTAEDIQALVGRSVLVGAAKYKVTAATSSSVTLDEEVTYSSGQIIYPGEAGAKGRAVYSTLILGADAYGVTEVEGGGLDIIVKQLGSAGSSDPLNQRASVGWKAVKTAERLVENYMVRIETASTFDGDAN